MGFGSEFWPDLVGVISKKVRRIHWQWYVGGFSQVTGGDDLDG